MRRTTDYDWKLSELMAHNAMHNSTDLAPHLADRGINLSSAQIWRMVTGRPERLSLPLLAALCDIFHCTPADLITTSATDAASAKRAVNEVTNLNAVGSRARPKRARVIADDR